MNDLVSIIVPTYNVGKYITETLDCVLAQTYQNWELEITDDCSSDETVNIIEEYAKKDSRIHLWRVQKNGGAGAARNNSIAKARGRFIAFLDSDDWWYPTKLEKQISFMLENNHEFTFTAFEYGDKDLNITGVSHKPRYISKTRMKLGNNIGTPGAIYDTKNIGKIYMPDMRKSEDWGLWIKIANKTNGAYSINEPLWIYRTLPNTLSRNKWQFTLSNIEMYKKVLNYSTIKAWLFFIFLFLPNHLYKLMYNKLDTMMYIKNKRISSK